MVMRSWMKSKLGANSILAVSMAVCRAGAAASHLPLYDYIAQLARYGTEEHHMPIPSFNIINGGAHSGNSLVVQEFMILPMGARSFREAMRIASEVYQSLKVGVWVCYEAQKLITKQYGSDSTNVGDEGGFAPNITNATGHNAVHHAMNSVNTAIELILAAIHDSGYDGKVKIGMDVAASEFYSKEKKQYDLLKKARQPGDSAEDGWVDASVLLSIYEDLVARYPIISIEDGFDEDDFAGWSAMRECLGASGGGRGA